MPAEDVAQDGAQVAAEVGHQVLDRGVVADAAGDGGALEALVRYAGAEEWYTVSGSPVAAGGEGHRASHEAVLARLTTPGPVEGGNEQPVDLRGW